jgi:hypothetical protein
MIKRLKATTIISEDLYIERGADRQLNQIIEDMGRPGYVLVARQMGKTNLLINCKRSRERKGEIVIYVDLSNRFETARALFRRIIDGILESAPEVFADLAPAMMVEREKGVFEPAVEYDRHLRRLLSIASHPRVVIVLDEIDSLVSVSYSDIVLAQVRSMYFSRINHVAYEKLTYVLSGVAEPTDLIKDKNISPFNIGEKIYLDDFNVIEIERLIRSTKLNLSNKLVELIAHWTGGNPRMVWDLCSSIEDQMLEGHTVTATSINSAVDRLYLQSFDRAPVDHIRVLAASDLQIRDAIIAIRSGGAASLDETIKSRLYLAGIIGSAVEKSITIKSGIIDAALSSSWLVQIAAGRRTLLQAASENYRAGRIPQAISGFEEAIKREISLGLIEQWEFGLALYSVSDFVRAEKYLRLAGKSPEFASQHTDLSYYHAMALLQIGHVEEGTNELLFAIQRGLSSSLRKNAELTLSNNYFLSKDPDKYNQGLELSLKLIAELRSDVAEKNSEADRKILGYALFNAANGYRLTSGSGQPREYLKEALEFVPVSAHPYIFLYGLHFAEGSNERFDIAMAAAKVILDNRLQLNEGEALPFSRSIVAQTLAATLEYGAKGAFGPLLNYAREIAGARTATEFAFLCELFENGNEAERTGTIGLIRIAANEFAEGVTSEQLLKTLSLIAKYGDEKDVIDVSERFTDLWLKVPVGAASNRDYIYIIFGVILRRLRAERTDNLADIFDRVNELSAELRRDDPFLYLVFLHQERQFRLWRGDHRATRQVAEAVVAMSKQLARSTLPEGTDGIISSIRTGAEKYLRSGAPDEHRHIGRNTKVTVRDLHTSLIIVRKYKMVEEKIRSGDYEFIDIA